MTVPQLLFSLVVIYLAAKLGAEAAVRLRYPPVLGELLGGVLVGVSGFALIDPHAEILHLLAELGILLLLFQIGLETKLRDLTEAGPKAALVAVVGMAAPFALGLGAALAFGVPALSAVLVGATLTATSIGIVARLLHERGLLASATASVILGAAVIDDVLGVSLLAVLSRMAEQGSFEPGAVVLPLAASLGFVLATLLVGKRLAAVLMRFVGALRGRGILLVAFTTFAYALAYLAGKLGSAPLIGAFAAGLMLEDTEKKHALKTQLSPVVELWAPIFFVTVGASLDLSRLNPLTAEGRSALLLTLVLTAAATAGKLLSGLAAWGPGVNRLAVGVGMLARGEVGLIFVGVGAEAGLLGPDLYAALVATIALTTLLAPPWLNRVLKPAAAPEG